MLLSFLKSIFSSKSAEPLPADQFPVARQLRTKQAHARAPIGHHLETLYGDLRVGEEPLNALVAQCADASRTDIVPNKALRTPLALYFLARYFLRALDVPGMRAECGVFQGASALMLCRAARTRDAAYAGTDFHLVDSFAGISEPTGDDAFVLPSAQGGAPARQTLKGGTLVGSLEEVRETLRDFPRIEYHRGWIPEVLASLPESRWSFVHVDVDLHDPTKDCLEYFYPRLAPGGVIICDDYESALFPGAYRAWNRFCDERDIAYVVLDTGQAVILKA